MGIAGAGVAGFVSTWVGLGIMVVYAMLPEYRQRFAPFSLKKIEAKLTWSILKLSIPSSVATIAVMTGFGLFAAIAGQLDQRFPIGVVSRCARVGAPSR